MDKKTLQISEAEWEVMRVLWNTPGLSAAQVSKKVSKKNHWSDGTTRTYLRRLIDKKVLRYEQDKKDRRIYYYFPIVSEQDALQQESKSFLTRIVKGSAGVVLASLIKDSELTNEEIKELQDILRKRRNSSK